MISKKHKNVCTTQSYIEHSLIFGSTITGCVSISPFPSLVGVPIGITSSATAVKVFARAVGIKKCKFLIPT